MKRLVCLSVVLNVALCTLTGCAGGGSSSTSSTQQQQTTNPTPAVTTVAPANLSAGSASQSVTITGTGFVVASVASFNGTALQTTYVSATSLQATVPAALLMNGQTAAITVANPAPGGGSSNQTSFGVTAPTPVLATLSPSYVLQGTTSVLLVTGTGFEANSAALLNGNAHAVNVVSATSLQIPLAAADTQASGALQVTVNNPGPGGSTSAASSFVIYPAPSIASLTPTSIVAGSSAVQLMVTGANFNANSVVQVDGAAQLTTFVSATSLQATVSATALAVGRAAVVTVHNPAPTIADSVAASLQVTTPLPVLAALNPAAIASGQAAAITLYGSGFQAASSVLWNGSARTTTYLNPGTLKVALTAADLQPGTGQITVVNPAPGGGTSAALSLTVVPPPTLTSLSPTTVQASASYSSAATTTLTLNGTNFASNAYVIVGGYRFAPTAQSATQLTISLSSNVLYYTGALNVQVYNPGPANGIGTVNFASQSLVLNVINPAATFTVNPNSAAVGSSAVTLNIYGSGFFADSVVQWNGVALATKYGSSSSLSATVPATLLTSLGTAVINVNTPENLGQATPTQTFSTYVGLQVSDIAWNATDGLIYATVPGSVGQGLGNSLVGIDPNTGAVKKTIFVGSEPNRLSISSDGTQAFVGLDGAGAFRQVNLTTATAGVQVSLGGGSGYYNPPYTAVSLAAVPGQPNAVALYSSNGVTTIYDAGVARTKTGGSTSYFGGGSTGSLAFGATAATLYLSNGTLTSYTVDATGIATTKSLGTSSNATAVQYDKAHLYLNNGSVTDTSGTIQGQFSVPSSYSTTPIAAAGPVVSDSSLNRAFVLSNSVFSSGNGVYVFDETTFDLLGSIPFSSSSVYYYGTTGDLIRWGQNGLAFHLGSQLVIQQSALVKDLSSTPVDLNLTAQMPASTTTGTSFATQFQVTNAGANSAAGVTLSFGLPATLIPGQVTASQGSCTGTGTVYCDLGMLANAASATVTVNATPTTAGSLQFTAVTNSQSFDSNTSNNQVTATTNVTGSAYNFAPVLTALSPNLVASGASTLTLTATGSGFAPGSVINWNGSALTTTFVSSTSLTAQVDASLIKTLGWASVVVTTAAPGGGTSGALTESIYSLISLPANAMVYDPFVRKLWTVLPSTAKSPTGNSLVSLDPATGTVGTAIQIGSEPNVLAETSTGNYLYIGLSGAKSLGRFNMATQSLDATIPLTSTGYFGGPVAANAVATIPGVDTSVAVPNVGILDFTGTTATVRANSALGYADAVFPDSTHAYTYDNQSTGAELYRYTVDAAGVHLVDATTLLGIGGFQGTIALDNGLLYGGAGGIVNPLTTPPSQVAVLPLGVGLYTSSLYGGGAIPYSAEGKSFSIAYNAAGSWLVYVERFDTQHFQQEDQLLLPTGNATLQTVGGTRWGQDGLAYLLTAGLGGSAPSQVLLLRGPFVLPAEALSNSAPTLTTVGQGTVAVGSGNQRIAVTGSGFLPGASVIWNGISHDTTYTDSHTLSVAVGASEFATAATVSVTCRNPGSTDSNAVSVTIR